MGTGRRARRRTAIALAATAVATGLLASVGVGAAMAATPEQQAGKQARHVVQGLLPDDHYSLTNDTPYVWTLDPSNTVSESWDGRWEHGEFTPALPTTLNPGEVLSRSKVTHTPGFNDGLDQWVSYTFTDHDGGRHLVQIHDDNFERMTSFSNDWDATGKKWVQSTATFHMAFQPGGGAHDAGAFLNKPVDITIDAAKDPQTAAEVMTKFKDGTDSSYTPTAKPTWTESNPVQGSSRLINATSADAELEATTGTTNSERTSLSLELGWKTGLDILGFANTSIEASVEGGHAFETSTEVENGNAMTVEPGEMGWFVKTTQDESVTGDFTFTYAGNVTYHVKNVTVSMPGVSQPGQGIPVPGTAFTPKTVTAPPLPPH